MPANLPPNYYEKERELKFASTPEEKIQIYLELLSIMPKHKGTDKLKADLRSKIAKLKRELGKKSGVARFDFYHVPKEGAAQAVMLGLPNSGKSQILGVLTNAEPEIRNYPFTTRKPQIGMLIYEDIQIQIVDMPPVSLDYAPGWIFGIARSSNLLLIVLDISKKDVSKQIEILLNLLESSHIRTFKNDAQQTDENFMYKQSLVLCNKEDMEAAQYNFQFLSKKYHRQLEFISISALKNSGIKKLKDDIYKSLNIIRVYTKPPKKDIDKSHPFVLKKNTKIIELASQIHKDFITNLKYVRLWRNQKLKGMRVDRDEILQDGDIIEFHTK